jgi:hypothetical protein
MASFERSFQNELGHNVQIAVATGVGRGTDVVLYRLAGPDSECEHTVTVMEATALGELLLEATSVPGVGAAEQTVARLRQLVAEMLSHFTEKGHPGRPCHRTGWVADDTIASWHRVYRATTLDAYPETAGGPSMTPQDEPLTERDGDAAGHDPDNIDRVINLGEPLWAVTRDNPDQAWRVVGPPGAKEIEYLPTEEAEAQALMEYCVRLRDTLPWSSSDTGPPPLVDVTATWHIDGEHWRRIVTSATVAGIYGNAVGRYDNNLYGLRVEVANPGPRWPELRLRGDEAPPW